MRFLSCATFVLIHSVTCDQVVVTLNMISGAVSNYIYNPRDFKYRVRHFSLCPQHAQMAESKVATLVCPFSIWPGQGFYVELFLIDAFPFE